VTTNGTITNRHIAAYALYELGGATQQVDVEDIFDLCFRIAPSRFGWRRHPEYPHFRNLAQALSDFERDQPKATIRGARGHTRQLSAEGAHWVEQRLGLFRTQLGPAGGSSKSNERPHRQQLAQLVRSPVAERYLAGMREAPKHEELAAALGIAPDRPRHVWERRIERLRAETKDAGREDLGQLVDWVSTLVPAGDQ
jgi:hypothetical protein